MTLDKISRFEKLLFFLVIMAIFLPVGFQYCSTGLVMLSALYVYSQRLLGKASYLAAPGQAEACFKRIVLISLMLFVAIFLNVLLSNAFSSYQQPWSKASYDAWHLAAKFGLWGAAMAATFRLAVARGWNISPYLKYLVAIVMIHTVYVVAQRYTGIHWGHGFGAVLGEHRFSYGVYRISGFMGHPLSFAYNIVLFSCLIIALLQTQLASQLWVKRSLGIILTCMIFTLLISGSRWPLAVLGVAVAITHYRVILQWWQRAILGFALVLTVLVWEGSFFGRMQELSGDWVSLEQRFDRLSFWRVHLEIFKDQPVLGVGVAARNASLADYYDRLGYAHLERRYNAHNIFLQTLADSGILGLAILITFLWYLLKTVKTQGPPWLFRGVLMLVTASVIAGMMQNVFRDTVFIIGFWLCLLILIAHAATESSK